MAIRMLLFEGGEEKNPGKILLFSAKQIVELELLEENSDGDEKDNSTNKVE